jgi:N-methylhydantoinase A
MDRLGVDIGGTFTDLYFFDTKRNKLVTSKVPSTPDDYTYGVMSAIEQARVNLGDISDIIHGSTIATNAVIERKLPRTPFITTRGFKDVIEIGRYHREKLYDPYQTKSLPLVKRRFRYEVSERIDSAGHVLVDLDESEALDIIEEIRKLKVTTVAVGFLNSYVNPIHEERMKAFLAREMPDIYVAISSTVLRKIRPLGRFTTTILNASLMPVISKYIDSLLEKLQADGFLGKLWLSQSNGGIISSDFIKNNPEVMLLSGPSMGIVASSYLCDMIAEENVITLDMGGTSADVSLVEKGQKIITTERDVGWDMPVPVPMLNIETIGAGGGSLAWLDQGGMLKVGPQSAGADPGPVCYRRGGTEPTVTDANLLLGRLNPIHKLGGKLSVDTELARSAIERLGKKVGLSWLNCAKGIVRIVEENMANAVKRVLISKSRDPREYVLVAFGGAGPMHACSVAKLLGIPSVVSPYYSGVLCALGASLADVIHNLEKTYYSPLDEVNVRELNGNYASLDEMGMDILKDEGFSRINISLNRIAEMRYVGQTYEVDTNIPSKELSESDLLSIKRQFDQMHEDRFGLCFPDDMVAFVNLRVNAIGEVKKQDLPRFKSAANDPPIIEERAMYFEDIEGPITGRVYDGKDILPGMSFSGPISIELGESTVIAPPDSRVLIDEYKNIIINLS